MSDSRSDWPPYEGPIAVVQPLPDLGDMVWHLPHIRAIAAHAGEPVTLLAKPSSLADQFLADEPSVFDIQWIDLNPGGRRGAHDGIGGFQRLVRKLRVADFRTVIILHHSSLIAFAVWRAGIPDRRGFGIGRQRWFLNSKPYLTGDLDEPDHRRQATRYLAVAGVPMASTEPAILVPPDRLAESMARLGGTGGGYVTIGIGIGGGEVSRPWGAESFGGLAKVLLDAGWPSLVLVGGIDDLPMATMIVNALGDRSNRVCLAVGWNLADILGVLSEARFHVGNDTGIMNIAAATGTRTYAVSGSARALADAKRIILVGAPGLDDAEMSGPIPVSAVLDTIRRDRGRLTP